MHDLYKAPLEKPLNFHDLNHGVPHRLARTTINAKLLKMAETEKGISNLTRATVPDERVPWDVAYPDYSPVFIDVPRGASSFRKNGDQPDPTNPNDIPYFVSLEVTHVTRNQYGYPLNPAGRTGLCGRGMLDKWGATMAADPILTRINPDTNKIEVLLIQRGDTGEWALPGGKVDLGEEPWQAAGRELIEEAGVENVELDFSESEIVYAGYVDDPRNTDNAWMETTALHIHLNQEQAQRVKIHAGSDATGAQWIPTTDERYDKLYAGQEHYINIALSKIPGQDQYLAI